MVTYFRIFRYLKRFDDEVEQIELKQSISKNRAHQHFSRLNAIKITIEKESAEYNGGGFGKLISNATLQTDFKNKIFFFFRIY